MGDNRVMPSISTAVGRAAKSQEEQGYAIKENTLLRELANTTDPTAKKRIEAQLVDLRCTMYAIGGVFAPTQAPTKGELDLFQYCGIRDRFKYDGYVQNCHLLFDDDAFAQCKRMKDIKNEYFVSIAGSMMVAVSSFVTAECSSAIGGASILDAVPAIGAGFAGFLFGRGVDRATQAFTAKPLHEYMANGIFNLFEMVAPKVNELAAELPSLPLPEYLE